MEQNRNLKRIIKKRLAEKKPLIQIVIGPRQVGKTTALKAALSSKAIYETADSPTLLEPNVIENWWQKAVKTSLKILAIDEIQKIPGWAEVIKKLWDTNPHQIKLIVTGSSSLLMEKGLTETLAGRFELIRAEHWNLKETQKIFGLSLREFIEFGCYPGSIDLLRKNISRWAQYIRDSIVEPVLGRDLLQLHPVQQPALLRQLFGAALSLPAQIISLQKIQGQLQGKGSIPTIKNYLQLLADAFLVTGIEKYSPMLIRSKKSSPKLIIHDNALLRAFERPVEKKLSTELLGHYFENCVGARFIEAGWQTYYWKDRNQEVDFVVMGPDGQNWAIEVKSAPIKKDQLKPLFKFCKTYPQFEPILVSLNNQKITGIKTVPIKKILSFQREYY